MRLKDRTALVYNNAKAEVMYYKLNVLELGCILRCSLASTADCEREHVQYFFSFYLAGKFMETY